MTHDADLRLSPSHTRVEGPLKVTGQARYETDTYLPNMAHAAVVRAPMRGRLTGLDVTAARAAPGVLDIFTHEQFGGNAIRPVKHAMLGGYANSTFRPLA